MYNSSAECKAFTAVELIIVIAIVAIIVAVAIPVIAGAQEKARQSTCARNLEQIGAAVAAYAQDNDQRYPSRLSQSAA